MAAAGRGRDGRRALQRARALPAQRLPAGVRVGTVDKFQGQEAPVVFYATASSSGEEIPRGLEFLFSRNRLNVAISRARCLAYLVGSPRLLDVRCRSVEQMRLVNALCRFVEVAESARPKLRIANRASSLISHRYHAPDAQLPCSQRSGGAVRGASGPRSARGTLDERRGDRHPPPRSCLATRPGGRIADLRRFRERVRLADDAPAPEELIREDRNAGHGRL